MLMFKIILRVAAIAMLLQLAMAKAKTYKVGGPHGSWNVGTNLQTWANSNKFFVGDSLSFVCREGDEVIQVWKPDYDACNATNPIKISAAQNTVITLTSLGISYFISGRPGECLAGVKIAITVLSPETSPLPPQASPSAASAPISSSPSPNTGSGGSPITSPASLVWPPPPSKSALPTALDIGSPIIAPSPSTLSTSSQPSSADNKINVVARFTMGLGFTIMMLLSLSSL